MGAVTLVVDLWACRSEKRPTCDRHDIGAERKTSHDIIGRCFTRINRSTTDLGVYLQSSHRRLVPRVSAGDVGVRM